MPRRLSRVQRAQLQLGALELAALANKLPPIPLPPPRARSPRRKRHHSRHLSDELRPVLPGRADAAQVHGAVLHQLVHSNQELDLDLPLMFPPPIRIPEHLMHLWMTAT